MNKRVKYILIGVGIIILIILIVPYFSINNSKSDKEDPMDKYYWDNREKVNLEMGKYVESKDYVLEDGNILVEVTNNNDYGANAKIYIEFFDENNESITMMDEYISHIGSAKKSYEVINIGEELRNLYKTYKIKVVLSYDSIHKSYYDNIKFISLDEKKGILKFKNNSNKKIDSIEWGILFYNEDNEIVGYETEYISNVKANKTVSESTYLPNITHSKIDVVLLQAYSYD